MSRNTMKKLIIILFSLIASIFLNAQTLRELSCEVVKLNKIANSQFSYELHVKNNTDSTYCLQYSYLIADAIKGDSIIELYSYYENAETPFFSLNFPKLIENRDFQKAPLQGIILMQGNCLSIHFSIPEDKVKNILKLNFLLVDDFCYKDFIKSMRNNISSWYTKYKTTRVKVLF